MKKIKVTKRVKAKVPWYERPPILFAVIAVGIGVAGLIMAHIYKGPGGPTELGVGSEGDSAAAVSEVVSLEEVDEGTLLSVGDPLPPRSPGEFLPPLRAETLVEAAQVREALRGAWGDGSTSSPEVGYGFIAGRELLAALQGGSTAGLWERLELSSEHNPWRDFEIQRVAPGEIYLLAFVSEEVGHLLGALAPDPTFLPALPVETHPWWQVWKWQVWKKKPEPLPLELRQGAILALHPDLNPEAPCAVALPLARLEPVEVREVRVGLSHLAETLEVRIR